MIEGRDFVFTGLQPWDLSIGSNARDIALEVSKSNRVLYVNAALSMLSPDLKSDNADVQQRQRVIRKQAATLRRVNKNLWLLDYPFTALPVNSLPDGLIFDAVNRINNYRFFRFVNKIIAELGFNNVIHFNDNDIYRSFYAKEYLNASQSIYYRRDNLLAIDFWKRHACRLEPLLIAKSDVVVCNSAELASVAKVNNPTTFDIGQGVDLDDYTDIDQTIPEDVRPIARPIVGYIGHITALRLDADIIYDLALANPTISFVLAGGEDEVFIQHKSHTLSNVYFLGSKPRSTVPQYIYSFDICVNPQLVNELTIGNYPRKIDEYLALGKPTIATRTRTMMLFDDYVYLCSSLEDYQSAIDQILKDGIPTAPRPSDELIAFAHSHTWEQSVAQLYRAIDSL